MKEKPFEFTGWNIALALAFVDMFAGVRNVHEDIFERPKHITNEDVLPEELVRWRCKKETKGK